MEIRYKDYLKGLGYANYLIKIQKNELLFLLQN